jgi:hypothetical protein
MHKPDIEALEIVETYIGFVNHLIQKNHNCNVLEDIAEKYQDFQDKFKQVLPQMERMDEDQSARLMDVIKQKEWNLYSFLKTIVNQYDFLSDSNENGGYQNELDKISHYHLRFNTSLTSKKKKVKIT